jgi:hypothetical protein
MGNDYMIEALAPNGTNHPLNVGSLPRRTRRGQHFLNTQIQRQAPWSTSFSSSALNWSRTSTSPRVPFLACFVHGKSVGP